MLPELEESSALDAASGRGEGGVGGGKKRFENGHVARGEEGLAKLEPGDVEEPAGRVGGRVDAENISPDE